MSCLLSLTPPSFPASWHPSGAKRLFHPALAPFGTSRSGIARHGTIPSA